MRLDELFSPANITRWSKRGEEVSKKRADRYGIRQHTKFAAPTKGDDK